MKRSLKIYMPRDAAALGVASRESALFVQASPVGLVQSPLSITANAGGTYTVTLTPLATLTPGHLTGTLALKLCYDAACTKSAPGSPVSLPYNFTVVAPPACVFICTDDSCGERCSRRSPQVGIEKRTFPLSPCMHDLT